MYEHGHKSLATFILFVEDLQQNVYLENDEP